VWHAAKQQVLNCSEEQVGSLLPGAPMEQHFEDRRLLGDRMAQDLVQRRRREVFSRRSDELFRQLLELALHPQASRS